MATESAAPSSPAATCSFPQPAETPTDCPICREPKEVGEGWFRIPECSHGFHEECVKQLRLKWDVDSGSCPVCRQPTESLTPVSVLLRQALARYHLREHPECREKLLEVLLVDEDHVEANYWLGIVVGESGTDLEMAMTYLHKAHTGGHLRAAFSLGVVHDTRGELGKAKKYYEEAHRVGHLEATYNLGLTHHRQGDLQKAQKFWEEAHSKGQLEATYNLGVMHQTHGDLNKAKMYWEEAHSKGHLEATFNLGVIHRVQRDLEKAKEYWEELYSKEHLQATFCLGVIHHDQQDLEKAKKYWEEAHSKGHLEAMFELGVAHRTQGDLEKAKKYWEEAHSKGHLEAAFELGVMYHLRGYNMLAAHFYQQSCEIGHKVAAVGLGELRMEAEEWDEAERLLKEAFAVGGTDAAYQLGVLHEKMGNMTKAHDFYTQAAANGDPNGFIGLGYLSAMSPLVSMRRWSLMGFQTLRRWNELLAEQHFSEVMSKGRTQTQWFLGLFRQRRGQFLEAEACYRAAAKSGNHSYKVCLVTLLMAIGKQDEAPTHLPRSILQFHDAQLQLQYWKNTGREPGVCALVLGYLHLLQGNVEESEALYAEAQQQGVPVPEGLHQLPPGFDDLISWCSSHPRDADYTAVQPPSSSFSTVANDCSSTNGCPQSSSSSSSGPSVLPPTAGVSSDELPGSYQRLAPHESSTVSERDMPKPLCPSDASATAVSSQMDSSTPTVPTTPLSRPQRYQSSVVMEVHIGGGGAPLCLQIQLQKQEAAENSTGQESDVSDQPTETSNAPASEANHASSHTLADLLLAPGFCGGEGQPRPDAPPQGSSSSSQTNRGVQPRSQSDITALLAALLSDREQHSGADAPAQASSSSSSQDVPLPSTGSHTSMAADAIPSDDVQAVLACLQAELEKRNKRLLERPPRELVVEQATILRSIRNRADHDLVTFESPEHRDAENEDVARSLLTQQLSRAREKLHLLTYNPGSDGRQKFHDLCGTDPDKAENRPPCHPNLAPLLAALREAGLPCELSPELKVVREKDLEQKQVKWGGVKMFVHVEHYYRAKDLLQEHMERNQIRLYPRHMVVSDSTMDLVLEALGQPLRSTELLADDAGRSVQVQLLGEVEAPSLPSTLSSLGVLYRSARLQSLLHRAPSV